MLLTDNTSSLLLLVHFVGDFCCTERSQRWRVACVLSPRLLRVSRHKLRSSGVVSCELCPYILKILVSKGRVNQRGLMCRCVRALQGLAVSYAHTIRSCCVVRLYRRKVCCGVSVTASLPVQHGRGDAGHRLPHDTKFLSPLEYSCSWWCLREGGGRWRV